MKNAIVHIWVIWLHLPLALVSLRASCMVPLLGYFHATLSTILCSQSTMPPFERPAPSPTRAPNSCCPAAPLLPSWRYCLWQAAHLLLLVGCSHFLANPLLH